MGYFVRPQWTSLSGSAHDNVPGRFNDVFVLTGLALTGSSYQCTGSLWGIGGVIVPAGNGGAISCSSGVIDAADIAGVGVVEVGPISIDVSGSSTIYALKRNHGNI